MFLHPDTAIRLVNLSTEERLAALDRKRRAAQMTTTGHTRPSAIPEVGFRQAIGMSVVRIGHLIQGAPQRAESLP